MSMIQIKIGILDGEVKTYLFKTSRTLREVLVMVDVPFENKRVRLNSVEIEDKDLDREVGNGDFIIITDPPRI